MDICVLLTAMNFVHLESREGCPFRPGQVKGLTRREGGNPVTVADIVVGAGLEFSSWGKESVNDSEGRSFLLPAKNEGLVVRVSESASTADWAYNVRSQRIVIDYQSCRQRKFSAAQKCFLTDPDERIQIH